MSSKRRETTETQDYVAMLSRMVRGLGRRVADGDPVDLAAAVQLQAQLDVVIRDAVAGMRTAGFSWQQLADELGTSKQAVQQKYGRRGGAAQLRAEGPDPLHTDQLPLTQ
jgi:hypothetical protein